MVRRLDSMPAAAVAAGFGVSLRTVRKWKSRYRQGGVEALMDKSSRPLRCRSKMTEEVYGEIFFLRQKRLTGDAIAARLGCGRSSVFRALRKLDCSRLASLEVKPPVRRYQWEKPGQMLHLDTLGVSLAFLWLFTLLLAGLLVCVVTSNLPNGKRVNNLSEHNT